MKPVMTFKALFICLIATLCFTSCSHKDVVTEPAGGSLPLPAKTEKNVAYGTDPQQQMDVYLPAGRSTDSTSTLVLIHGGAWLEGDKKDFDSIVIYFQQQRPHDAIVNINYRLATETTNHFPAQEEDIVSAIRFLEQMDSTYHLSKKMIVMGASAGAHLALLEGYKHNDGNIKGVVDFFGPADMTALYNNASTDIEKMAIATLLNGTPAANSSLYFQSSPVNYVTQTAPPTFITHGQLDTLVSINQSIALKAKLDSLHIPSQLVTYPNHGHGWSGPDLLDALNKTTLFLNQNIH